MGILVKICGINSPDAADAAVGAGADMVGLNFHRTSPRYVDAELAQALASRLRGRTRIVVILSDPTDDETKRAVTAVRPDFLQLHGTETPNRVAQLREQFGLRIIKSLAVEVGSDLAVARGYEEVADFYHFDAKAPPNAERLGGHGVAFDWRILRDHHFPRPWLLAGGLTAENVARAIAISGAPGADVSSGVETAPGQKSPELIRNFVTAATQARFHIEEGA